MICNEKQKKPRRLKSGSIIDYLIRRMVVDSSTGCWNTLGKPGGNGYGQTGYLKKNWPTHRLSYEMFRGPIPVGLQLDHLCRNPLCLNPDHLEVVTPKENVLRGHGLSAQRKRQTRCKYGHEFTPENTWTGSGHRKCRTCGRILAAQRRFKKKSLAADAKAGKIEGVTRG